MNAAPKVFTPDDVARRTAALTAALPRHACVACGIFGSFSLDGRVGGADLLVGGA